MRFSAHLIAIAMVAAMAPASAKDYITDGAGMFSPETLKKIARINAELEQKTGTFVAVTTVKTSGDEPLGAAAAQAAAARHISGAIIYVDRDPRRFAIVYGPKANVLFTPELQASIEQSLSAAFRAGQYDSGIVAATSAIADVLAGGRSAGHGPMLAATQTATSPKPPDTGFGWVVWVAVIIVGTALMIVLMKRR
jgi:uncharacterized membrane protein YgcG